ncbi:MAG: carbohydrate porin [Methylophilaceae bacterium]|nr:carbohydrate porin [Methylophilaceae bacterium]
MHLLKKTIVVIAATCALSAQAMAEEAELPNWQEDTLTGDWGGLRADLYKKGIELGFTHKSDVLANVSGGLKRGVAWLGHTEARFSFDLEKLWGWDGTTIYAVYHSDLGSKFNSNYVGGFMGVDNIEVGTNTAQFYQAYAQKNFLDNHISVLAGLYAIDTEFYVPETSGIFLQPPYGMANEVAQAGINGPAIFPLGALAVRLKLKSPGEHFYAMAALTDGVPGNPNDQHGTSIRLDKGDGTFFIAEFGYTPPKAVPPLLPAGAQAQEETETFNKTAIGYWRYSGQFDAIDGSGSRHRNQGIYLIAERTLFNEKEHPSQGLAAFLRFGVASDSVNQADWSGSLGLRYRGLIAGRDDDIAGLAVTVNHAGNTYRQANASESHEANFEATYRAQITPYFAVQPSVQLITNPNMDASMKNAWVIGSRFEVEF